MQIALNTIALEPARWDKDKSRAASLETLLPAVAAAGYSACEVWQYHLTNRRPEDIPTLAEIARRHSLTFCAIGAYPQIHLEGEACEAEMATLENLMTACVILGAKILKIFTGRLASAKIAPEERSRSIEFLQRLAARARTRDLLITAETHPNTLADSVSASLALIQDVAAPNFKLCYQPFDMLDTERAIADYERLKEAIVHIHLQARNKQGFCLMAESPLDHARYLRRVRESGFDGLLSVEFVKDCHPAVRESFSLERVVSNAAADLLFIKEIWESRG